MSLLLRSKWCCLLIFLQALSHLAQANSLEIIQVSASRLAKSNLATPVSLSTLVPETPTEHPAQWFNSQAGVWLTQTSGQEQLTAIRSPVLTGPGSCSEFYFAQDQIPLRANGFCNVNQLFEAHTEAADLIEISKGPASALVGSSALFGSVNVRLPTQLLQNSLSLALKGTEFQQLNLAIEPPGASNSHALVTLSRDSGYREESGFNQQKVTLGHQGHWRQWQLYSTLSYQHLNQRTAGFIEGENAYLDKALRRYNPTPEAYRNSTSWRAQSRFSRALGSGQLTLTPYLRTAQMKFLMHFVPWQPEEENRHTSVGLQTRYQQPISEKLTLYTGAELEWTKGLLSEYQPEPAPFSPDKFPQGWHYNYKVNALAGAADLGLSWQPVDSYAVDFAIRFDHNSFDYHNQLSDGPACVEQPNDCRFYRPASYRSDFTEPSTRLAFSYFPSSQQHWYLQLNRAFRSPHTSEMYRLQQGQQQANLKPVELDALELGYKVQLPRVQLSWALYAMWRDQVIFMNSERHYVGGASTEHHGLEYQLAWQINQAWQLTVNGSYAQHSYSNNPDLLNSSASIEGNEIDTAPRQLNWAQLAWHPMPELQLQLEWQQKSRYYLNPENSASYSGHQLLQLAAHWQLNRWQLQAEISNLSDRAYARRADISFGQERYLPGEGRRIQLSLSTHW